MRRDILIKLVLAAAAILPAIIFASCTSSVSSSENKFSQTAGTEVLSNSGGSVTIDVRNMGIRDGSLAIEVSMNTHSVNLDQYDLMELATLKDGGGKEYLPAAWNSAPGGHHRNGTLVFDKIGSQGTPGPFELVIRDVAGIQERVFKWELAAN